MRPESRFTANSDFQFPYAKTLNDILRHFWRSRGKIPNVCKLYTYKNEGQVNFLATPARVLSIHSSPRQIKLRAW